MKEKSNLFRRLFILVSLLIPAVVVILLVAPKRASGEVPPWIYSLPFYNAVINTLTSIPFNTCIPFFSKRQPGKGQLLKAHRSAESALYGTICYFCRFIYGPNRKSLRAPRICAVFRAGLPKKYWRKHNHARRFSQV